MTSEPKTQEEREDRHHQQEDLDGLDRPAARASGSSARSRSPRRAPPGRRSRPRPARTAGVLERGAATGAEQELVVDVVVGAVDLLGEPAPAGRRCARPTRKQHDDQPGGRTAGSSTCQTSVLMNRNVTNSSSRGSAREVIGSSRRRLPRVRLHAQPRIGRACRAVTAYQSEPSTASDSHSAGAGACSSSESQASATAAGGQRAGPPRRQGSRRRGRRAARTAARTSGTK